MPKKVSDGTEHCAHVLFTELVTCKRVGTVFYAGGRSKDYERCGAMTEEYTRALVATLSQLLAELDAERGAPPTLDGIKLRKDGDGLAFELTLQGNPAGSGRVTREVVKEAKAFIDKHFPPDNVVRLRKRGADALLWLLALTPIWSAA